MSLATPSKIRELQIKLYRKAKNEPGYRFYMLYDKIYREDILFHAYELARANKGAPGVDGQSFEEIESKGVQGFVSRRRESVMLYEKMEVGNLLTGHVMSGVQKA